MPIRHISFSPLPPLRLRLFQTLLILPAGYADAWRLRLRCRFHALRFQFISFIRYFYADVIIHAPIEGAIR